MPRDRDAVALELLAVRCRRGDRDAFEELIRTWEERLLYFIRRIVRSEADAWDILQKSWLRVLKGIRTLDDPKKIRPWIYRIVRNVALTHTRMRGSQPDNFVEEANEVEDESVDRFEFENAELVHRGLEIVSQPHREVLTLVFLEDMTIDEVSFVLGLPAGTVKSRIHYAKRSLRIAIERAGGL